MAKNLHSSWHRLTSALDKITAQYGSSFYDTETSQTLDVGQALCRTVYGTDWQTNEEFEKVDNQEPGLPVPEHVIQAAENWASGNIPEWTE